MTIRKKLFACLSALALAIVAIAGLSFWSMTASKAALDTILQDRVVPMRDLKIVADKYAVDIVDASHKARNGNFSFLQAAEKVRNGSLTLHERWKAYLTTEIDGDEAQLAKAAEDRMRVADERVAELQSILDRGDRAALDNFVQAKLYQAIDPVSEAIGRLVDLQLKIADQTGSAAVSTAQTSRNAMYVLIAAAMAVLAVSFFIIALKVVAPIKRLANTLPALVTGNGTVEMPHLGDRDEVGEIARAVDSFRRAVVSAEQEKTLAVAKVTDELASALASLAQGDLTCQLSGQFPPAYAKVQSDFNGAIGSLRDTLSEVAEAAGGIHNGTSEIRQASDDLAQRTERQAASLEETAAAMDEITSTVRSAAQQASGADAAVRSATKEAEHSDEIVRRTIEAMGAIERTSGEISEIITVIDGIAFQTNLLALNAGVEAARAGDAGKGFAVVASEVRALAQRSADAAKDVKERITMSSEQVSAGVQLVGETGQALRRIICKVGEIDSLVSNIAASAEQQATGLQQINVAVSEMDGVTQQNAAMVEEATAASRSLAAEADALARQIGRFNLGRQATAAPTQPANPVHQLQARATRAQRPARQATHGNTALAVQNDDDWSEF